MKTFFRDVKRNLPLLIMALPAVIYIIMFNYVPMFGIVIAFKDFNYRKGIFGSEWCGLDNFKFLLESGDLAMMLRNTIAYNIVFIITGIIIAITLAILFDALGKTMLNRINQTIVIMPHFLSMVVVSYFVYSFLSVDKGVINQILKTLGIGTIDWYSEPKFWPFILWIVKSWSTVGWSSVIYYSTIKGFSSDYYEAAKIDGASWWRQVKNITIPLLKPTIIVLLITNIGHILTSGVDLFYLIPRNSVHYTL